MINYLTLILKCILFYFIIIFALRCMGKREIGELSIFDIVIYLVMSELLALSLTKDSESIFMTLVPLITLSLLQILVAYIIMKSGKLRNLIDGKPVIIIENGRIDQKVMKKERYNIDDLMMQIRECDIGSIHEIAYAILETNGRLTILKKNDCKVKYPFPLIQDGILMKNQCQACNIDIADLISSMNKEGIISIKEVFLCLYTKNGLSFIKKN